MKDRPNEIFLRCVGVGVLHLAKNLRLANHLGIEARGDPERVGHCVQVLTFIGMLQKFLHWEAFYMREHIRNMALPCTVCANAIYFNAVTGVENGGLFEARMLLETGLELFDIVSRQSKALPDFKGRLVMVASNGYKSGGIRRHYKWGERG